MQGVPNIEIVTEDESNKIQEIMESGGVLHNTVRLLDTRSGRIHVQSRSRFTFSTAFAFPFSPSFIRRMDSSITLMSAPAFRPRSLSFVLSVCSSFSSSFSSDTGGSTSGVFRSRFERNGGGDG